MIDHDTTAIERALATLSRAAVCGLACQALGGAGWEAREWRSTHITMSHGPASRGIYRLSGTAGMDGQARDWSVILKVVTPLPDMTPAQNEIQTHPLYWKREVLAYQSGWLEHLPGGLRGARCLGVETLPDGPVWLWLEDVRDRYGEQWPLAQYARAAGCLGRFNGAYLAGQPRPPFGWLSGSVEPRGVIEAFGWVEALVRDPATWKHPWLREIFPEQVIAGLPGLWDSRERLLAAFECLPKTVCHQDAWRGNLFAGVGGKDDELVVIDWAYFGWGVAGTDLGDLAVAGYEMLPSNLSLAEIDGAVFEAYLAGLREAGWPARRNEVRFAYTTFAALKYGCLLLWLRNVLDENARGDFERVEGSALAANLRHQAVLLEHLLRLHAEALSLLESL
jgi:hypothetical protein